MSSRVSYLQHAYEKFKVIFKGFLYFVYILHEHVELYQGVHGNNSKFKSPRFKNVLPLRKMADISAETNLLERLL